MITVDKYTQLITNEHVDKPKFRETVVASTEPYVDIQNVLNELIVDFDIDSAIGVQLDAVGAWIGQSRNVTVPILGVYFTWDDTSVNTGWDVGNWKGVGQPDDFTIVLNDNEYRSLLKSKILSNNWKGVNEDVYDIIDAYVTTTTPITVSDNQDMTQTITLPQAELTQDQIDVITSGYVIITPAGVREEYILI